MANNIWLVALSLFCISLIGSQFGKAEEGLPQSGGAIKDPTQIVDKALTCFNDKYVYSTCEKAYRLGVSGNLHVPSDHTDEFCNGSCLRETNLVLHCIENMFENFEFYNRATVRDVRETVKSGCGDGIDRGNFDVTEHIQAEENKSQRTYIPLILVIVCVALTYVQMRLYTNVFECTNYGWTGSSII